MEVEDFCLAEVELFLSGYRLLWQCLHAKKPSKNNIAKNYIEAIFQKGHFTWKLNVFMGLMTKIFNAFHSIWGLIVVLGFFI